MFGDYETEEQQVEALKTWWKENRNALFVGVSLGLAGIFGYNYWAQEQLNSQREASAAFNQLLTLETEEQSKSDELTPVATRSLENSKSYAAGALLLKAKSAVESGDLDAALDQLQQARDTTADSRLHLIIDMRRSRVLLAQALHDEALAALPTNSVGIEAAIAELKGDIFYHKGDLPAAREQYQIAIDSQSATLSNPQLLQAKFNDAQPRLRND